MNHKAYIGDGVYADFDGFALILTTEDGLSTSNTIVLEPGVIVSLEMYLAKLKATIAAGNA